MDPLEQVKLLKLMHISKGRPEIVVGVIDGPVDFSHPSFEGSSMKAVEESQAVACETASSIACAHGTFVTGILCGRRDSLAPAICPGSTIILRPIFNDSSSGNNTDVAFPTSTPKELSNAIIETVDSGARIINLSLGLSGTSLVVYHELEEAYDYARQKGVVIVAAAGNQGKIAYAPLLNNKWVIPVAASDENGMLSAMSNYGSSIRYRGLMAPGVNIGSAAPGGGYTKMTGTSFAAAFVTGTIALLWSVFPKAEIAKIVQSLVRGYQYYRRTIMPSLLNAEAAWKTLKDYY